MPRSLVLAAVVCAALAATLALAPAAHARPGDLPSTNVAWLTAAVDADADRAFAQARSQNKPVLLYWGASWCPPCNQLKATLFNRQDFAAKSRHFVAVFVDGDRPSAQKLGARFKVGGYPTLVLFTPDGREITRLPGEADAPQVLSLLEAGLAGGRPVAAVLADARAGKTLSANEWRMLSFHSWVVDDSGLVAEADRPAVLAELAVKAQAAQGDTETTTRLWLKALAASDDGKGVKPDDTRYWPTRRRRAPTWTWWAAALQRWSRRSPATTAPSVRRWWRSSTPCWRGCRPTPRCRAATG